MKKKILIVEDNEDNRILADKILKYYGFETFLAPHGEAALQFCESMVPDLILMDLSLPDIDGLEITRLLRKKEQFKSIPIIALTAHTLHGIEETTHEAGLDDFLAKPFLPNDLINLMHKYLNS